MTTIEQLIGLTAQHNELIKRVGNGSLDPVSVRRALQDIIEGKFASSLVSSHPTGWYTAPIEQVARMAELLHSHPEWGFTTADIPVIPDDFTLVTSTEVLLLTVELPKKGKLGTIQRTFDVGWELLSAPAGFSKYRWPDLSSDAKHLRLVDGKAPKPGLRWVAFDPFAHWVPEDGRRVDALWANEDAATLAASEVLWAAVMFPNWVAMMDGTTVPYADMAGYQFNWDGTDDAWTVCPYVYRSAAAREVKLHAIGAVYRDYYWAAPSVREL